MDQPIQLFEGYPRGLQEEAISRFCEVQEYQPGAPILVKGNRDTHLCIVISGQADALITRRLTVPFRPGQFFGELSFIDGKPRSAKVEAAGDSPTRIARLSREALKRMVDEEPRLANIVTNNLLQVMARHVRDTDEAIQGLDVRLQRKLGEASPGLLSRLATSVLS